MQKWLVAAGLATALTAGGFAAWAQHGEVTSPSAQGSGAAAPSSHEAHGPGEINWADFGNAKQRPYAAMLANFAILLFLYYRFGKAPIAAALRDRRANVARELAEAQRMKAEAKGRAKEYEEKLARLDADAETAKKALVEAGRGEKERIVREAEEKAARMRRDAALLLEQEMKQRKLDLHRETVEKATQAAEALLTRGLTPDDHARLAEDFLTQLATPRPSDGPAVRGTP